MSSREAKFRACGRTLFALPARVTLHARPATVRLLGISRPSGEATFNRYGSAVRPC